MARQTNKGKARRREHGHGKAWRRKADSSVSLRHHGKSVYNLEMHDLQFGIVISL